MTFRGTLGKRPWAERGDGGGSEVCAATAGGLGDPSPAPGARNHHGFPDPPHRKPQLWASVPRPCSAHGSLPLTAAPLLRPGAARSVASAPGTDPLPWVGEAAAGRI